MKPTIETDDYALYHGDARTVLAELAAVQTLLTDPVWPNCPPNLLPGADDPAGLLRWTLEVMPVLPQRLVVVLRGDCDPRFLAAVPVSLPFFRTQLLPYAVPGHIGRKLGGDELAYCFGEPIASRPGARVIPGRGPTAQPNARPRNGHPCSRCLSHFLWLVSWWSEVGETVLDPFMGSGTTGAACLATGRKFIGVEVESRFFDLAAARLEKVSQQGKLDGLNG